MRARAVLRRPAAAGVALVAALAALAGAPAPAAADRADKADALFTKGKAQLARKQYAEACATFERVDELDPGIGAKLNVARCYEEWGKLARAHKWYVDAQKMAADGGDKRAPKIQALVDKIEPAIPRLTINVPAGADARAAGIAIDGDLVLSSNVGRELPVDPGPHVITYRSGSEQKSRTIAIERGGAREVTLEIDTGKGDGDGGKVGAKEPGKGKGKGKSNSKIASPPAPGRGRRIAAITLMGAGVVGMGASGYLAIGARSDYRSALDAHCMGATNMCDDEGLRLTHDARSRANLGTIFAVAGAALVGGGVALYLTAPSAGRAERRSRDDEALYIAPALGDRSGFVVIGGRY